MNSSCSCETMMFSSLRGSPTSARFWSLRGRSSTVVPVHRVVADEELHAAQRLAAAHRVCVRVVQERLVERTGAVQRVEVEAGGAEVAQRGRVVVAIELRRRIERDVVIDELAEVGVPGGEPEVLRRGVLGQDQPPREFPQRVPAGIAECQVLLVREQLPEPAAARAHGRARRGAGARLLPGRAARSRATVAPARIVVRAVEVRLSEVRESLGKRW